MREFDLNTLLKPTKTKRVLFFLIFDTILIFFSFYLSFLLRFNFSFPEEYKQVFCVWFFFLWLSKIGVFWYLGIYKINWRFVGLYEFLKLSLGTGVVTFIAFWVDVFIQRNFQVYSVPLSVILIDFFISLFFLSTLRICKRVYLEFIKAKTKNKKKVKRVVVIGAGNTGERIVRELKRDGKFNPVFLVDDDPNKIGTYIHGVPVLGSVKDLPGLLKENRIDEAIIAIPSLAHKEIKKIFELLRENGVTEIKIVPSLSKLPSEVASVKDLKEISIEDLLCREPVKINYEKLKGFLSGRKILVTGAGGSIGSEIVRQLLRFEPREIVAIEIDETELHNLSLEILESIKNKNIAFKPIVADIRDKEKINKIFIQEKPEIVFHAAAYKHVPLMEYFPEEAVRTNIFGTYYMAIASLESGVEKFVNISTDKAVNPTSIMGATKRMAEMICKALNDMGKTKFISVRFGNVLGSRGSVIPIFLEQIKKGGPVTVTHPEMKRYFMTISEAVLLVFEAAAMGKGGEVFVLDMGEPVKIVKLAEELIKLQGLEPYKDIDIVFTGLRPGEKLFEELLTAEEGTDKTCHEKIYIARIKSNFLNSNIEKVLSELEEVLMDFKKEEIKKILKKYVPFYHYHENQD